MANTLPGAVSLSEAVRRTVESMQQDPAPDSKDAAHALTSEALTASANIIREKHEDLENLKGSAIEALTATMDLAVEISSLVEQAHAQLGGARFAQWWREQGLPAGWNQKYLTLAKSKRANRLADKDQLRLIGFLETPEGGNPGQQRKRNPFEFIKWSGKIAKSFEEVDIASLSDADREGYAKHLEPVAKLYNQLTA